jgi:heterogeneous nuclear rnp K-like protein 2
MQPTYNPYAQHPQAQAAYAAAASAPTATQMEQKIYIPNDLVGCIIGKGGVKINEIRQLSQCMIKITEPGSTNTGGAENERLVVITGASHNIQMAVSMLYNVGVMSELLVEVTDRPFAAS